MENNNIEKKLCPLAKNYCVEESCAWFVAGPDECAVNFLAQCAETISDFMPAGD